MQETVFTVDRKGYESDYYSLGGAGVGSKAFVAIVIIGQKRLVI